MGIREFNFAADDYFPDPRSTPSMSVCRAARFYGFKSLSGAYDAAARGDLPTIRNGSRLLVPTGRLAHQLQLTFPEPPEPPEPPEVKIAGDPHRGQVIETGERTTTRSYRAVCATCGWVSKSTHHYSAACAGLGRHCATAGAARSYDRGVPDTEPDRFPDPRVEPTMTVERAGRFLGLRSRTGAYDAASRGDLPTIRVGSRIMVLTAALARQLQIVPPQPTTSSPAPAAPSHHGKVTNSGDNAASMLYRGTCSCGWTGKATHHFGGARADLANHNSTA